MFLLWHNFVAIFAFCIIPYISSETIDGNYGYSDISNTKTTHNSDLCFDLRPQHTVNIKQIMGEWYGNEIINHDHDIPGIYHYDSCVIINLYDATEQMQSTVHDDNYDIYRRPTTPTYQQQQYQYQQHQHYQRQDPQLIPKYLRLIWSEKGDNLEYIFNYTESNPGLWHNIGEQHGSLVSLKKYNQFSGNVLVVKAVADHLVLSFCDIKSSTYSIVLSRTPDGLNSKDINSVRNLLSRRSLSVDSIRKICSSDAMAFRVTSFVLLMGIYLSLRKLI